MVRLDYDDEWSSGGQVKGPNDPELGVGIFETEIPFAVEVGLHSCNAPAEYSLVLSVMAGENPIPLSTESISVSAGGYFEGSFAVVLPSGDSDQVELVADLYYNPPPTSSALTFATVVQQAEPQDPPPLLKLHERIVETTDRWRMELLDALPESATSKGIDYARTVAPRKAADKLLDSLMTDEIRQQVIAHILESDNNISPESAADVFAQRLQSAKEDLAETFKPLFADVATWLFMTDRPDAEVLAGASDPVDPLGKVGQAFNDMRAKIDAYVDNLPSLDDYPAIKRLDFDIDFASVSDILKADAASSLKNKLKAGNFSGVWDAVRKTDVRTIAFVKSLSITYPIADDGRLMLSAENVSASGVGGFRLGGELDTSLQILGRNVKIKLNPSVLHKPNDPYNFFGQGHQQYEVGASVIVD